MSPGSGACGRVRRALGVVVVAFWLVVLLVRGRVILIVPVTVAAAVPAPAVTGVEGKHLVRRTTLDGRHRIHLQGRNRRRCGGFVLRQNHLERRGRRMEGRLP